MLDNLDEQAAELLGKLGSPETLEWAQKTAEFMMATWVRSAYLSGMIALAGAALFLIGAVMFARRGMRCVDREDPFSYGLGAVVCAVIASIAAGFGLHLALIPEAYALAKWVALIRGG